MSRTEAGLRAAQSRAGPHFREEFQTSSGEARRDDERWCSVSVWETTPEERHVRHIEALIFDAVALQVRDYR